MGELVLYDGESRACTPCFITAVSDCKRTRDQVRAAENRIKQLEANEFRQRVRQDLLDRQLQQRKVLRQRLLHDRAALLQKKLVLQEQTHERKRAVASMRQERQARLLVSRSALFYEKQRVARAVARPQQLLSQSMLQRHPVNRKQVRDDFVRQQVHRSTLEVHSIAKQMRSRLDQLKAVEARLRERIQLVSNRRSQSVALRSMNLL